MPREIIKKSQEEILTVYFFKSLLFCLDGCCKNYLKNRVK
jgi:hypothetical protein